MTDDPQTEDPTKASKPIPEPPAEGELLEAFRLTVSLQQGVGFQVNWTVGSEVVQAFFFQHHPIAAAMLSSIVQPLSPPPIAPTVDPTKKIGELGPLPTVEDFADQIEGAILKDPKFRKPSPG